jgi:hypothetical protein
MTTKPDFAIETVHLSEPGCLDEAEDGWFYPLCSCGWKTGPMPDVETAVDSLMGHVWRAAKGMGS